MVSRTVTEGFIIRKYMVSVMFAINGIMHVGVFNLLNQMA